MNIHKQFGGDYARGFMGVICLLAVIIAAMPAPAACAPDDEQLVTMDFRDTEIGDVLRLLAKQNDLNIILSDAVRGPVTVQFNKVTVNEALDAIVTVNGYAYTRRGRIIKVTTPEEAEREAPSTRVFSLDNASAESLKVSLQSVLSVDGMIESDTRSNSLIVTDNSTVIGRLEDLVSELDSDTPQIMIEAKIIETVLDKNEKLGIDWNLSASASGGASPWTFPFSQTTNTARAFRAQGQTATETTVVETSSGSAGEASEAEFPSAYSFPYADPSDFTFGTLDFSQFQVVMDALDNRANTSILANPRIVTLDNQEAKINVGTTVPVPLFERNENTGVFEITGYEDQDTGIILTVTPHVTRGDHIQLNLHPEVSSIINYVGDTKAQVPVTSKREALTQVSIRDGQTVVIGGLIDEKEIESLRKVPFLGEVPLLGKLFSHRTKTKDKTDLLIFITARILNDEKHEELSHQEKMRTGNAEVFPEIKPEENSGDTPKSFRLNHRPKKPLVL